MAASAGETIYESLRRTAREAPQAPGCYLWRDGEGEIIYIGKAKSLRNRLSSYFSGGKDVKTATLIRRAASIETIIVANEYEALLLENTLIKQHSPKYNIDLKDGKSYPVVRVTSEEFPRVFKTRHIVEDGSRYYGPFPNSAAVDTMLAMIERLFPLRKCRRLLPKKRGKPCMYYHIGRCAAPCCGKITAADYGAHVEHVARLLAGETDTLAASLRERMAEAAADFQYERAASLRDAVRAVEALASENAVVDFDTQSRDYIAWAAEGVLTTFSVFSMRSGKLTGRDLYRARSAAAESETLEQFLTTYYDAARPPPAKVYVVLGGQGRDVHSGGSSAQSPGSTAGAQSETLPPAPALERYFIDRFGYAPVFCAPDEKRHEAALAMARQNAVEDLRKRLKERGAGPALDELARVLGLGSRPERIEGFDIAQLDGKHPVASLISFRNGIPDRRNYRLFKLRSVVGIVDDFAAMREAVRRRYSRLAREGAELPGLILIDGGIGQVNAARGVLDDLGLDIPVAGLAKRDEEIWLPSAGEQGAGNGEQMRRPAVNPIRLSRDSEALKVLQAVRDETHRFATGHNQRLRSKDLRLPVLQGVAGVGEKRAAAIMQAYGTLDALAAAAPDELARRCRLTTAVAREVVAAARLALENQALEKKRLSGNATRRGRHLGAWSDDYKDALAAQLAAEQPDVFT